MEALTTKRKIKIKAAVNEWLSSSFNDQKKYISLDKPKYNTVKKTWSVPLSIKKCGGVVVGKVQLDSKFDVINHTPTKTIVCRLQKLKINHLELPFLLTEKQEVNGLFFGDGIEASKSLEDKSVDLLLTDPPYGISNPYTCEKQIPRRMRRDGSDFIMPKGSFGEWDYGFDPYSWTKVVIPKVKGWAAIFCAHSQIKDYSDILKDNKFNAIGTFVWHKTNPVPFNHKFKPINAWEAIVVGKIPGTQFNGRSVHNVFKCKSPSPQHRIHPTQKPLELIEKLMGLFSNEKDLILDPFAGSGTTTIVANKLKRKIISYENDREHYEKAVHRIIKANGQL